MGDDPKSSDNPTRAGAWHAHLLLAWSCPRCGAKTRSGRPCRSAAMRNGRCRLHGGASPGAPEGERHGMWKLGLRSRAVIEQRRAERALLREIRRELEALGASDS